MKVLLVNSPVLSVLEPWYDTPDFVRTGLAYLAGYVKEHSEHEIGIIDAKFERLDFEETIKKILSFKPDLVGFTAFTNEIKPAAYLAAKLKQLNRKLTTVIGGVHLSALPIQTFLEFESFDLGVFGEGEITFLELINSLENGQSLANVKGLIYRGEDSKPIKNETRNRVLELDNIQQPAWDLLPAANTYFIQAQRGCPLNCSFCMNPGGKAVRHRSIENIIEEIQYLIEEKGAKKISFGDEIFTVNKSFTISLLKVIIENKLGSQMEWDVQTHVRFVDREIFQLFYKANVNIVELGVETGDEELLKKMGKGTNLNMIQKAFQLAKEEKVKTGAFFLFGQPNETLKTLRKTIKLALFINPDVPMFGLMVPYPGTKVSEMASNNSNGYRLISRDWDDYNKQLGGALEFAGISRNKIEYYQIIGYLKVFIFNFRYFDLINFLWKYRIGAISVLKKLFSKANSLNTLHTKPVDYDEMFTSEEGSKLDYLKGSFENWKKYQKRELQQYKLQSEIELD
jgi:radical SAM superfamily enzyme YgiQ (UPF0313 family)